MAKDEVGLLEEVDVLVMEEGKIVTSKWLSRHMAIPIASSKRVLSAFCKQKGDAVSTVWQVSGWLREDSTNASSSQGENSLQRQFQVSIAPAARLQDTLSLYSGSPVPHVYSVQKALPVDPALLCVAEKEQAEELIHQDQSGVPGVRPILGNSFSAVLYVPLPGLAATKENLGVGQRSGPKAAPKPDQSPLPEVAQNGHSGSATTASRNTLPAKEQETKPKAEVHMKSNGSGQAGNAARGTGVNDGGKQPAKTLSTPSPKLNGQATSAHPPSASSLASLWKKSPHSSSDKEHKATSMSENDSEKDNKNVAKNSGGPLSTKLAKPASGSATATALAAAKEVADTKSGEGEEEDSAGDEAAEFAMLWAGQVSKKNGLSKRQGKRMKVLDDDDEDEEEDQTMKDVPGGSEGGPSLQGANLDGKDAPVPEPGSRHGPSTAGVDSSAVDDNAMGSKPTEPVSGNAAGASETGNITEVQDKQPPSTGVKQPAAGASVPAVAAVNNVSGSQGPVKQLGGGKRKKVMKTIIDDKGRETTVVVWENADGSVDLPAGGGTPATVPSSSGPVSKPKQQAPSSFPSVAHSKNLDAPQEAAATKNAPQRGKATPKAPKAGQGSITSFFRKRS